VPKNTIDLLDDRPPLLSQPDITSSKSSSEDDDWTGDDTVTRKNVKVSTSKTLSTSSTGTLI